MRLADLIHLAVAALMSLSLLAEPTHAAEPADTSRGDQMLAAYFRSETQKLADASDAKLKSWNDWFRHRDEYRQQLQEMLGLDPLPERTPLNPVVTGTLEHDDFKVEKLYFQSRPHLYVTGNLYLPKKQTGRVPAILYVCGHSPVKKDGVSLGNKTHYQHHGAWFARNGYACLVIDTLQLGEIEGIHHGTYRENIWWWNARGYTPAGVETWNSMRAIDYLVSRPEVDPERIGMTGRSGGGAYTWYTAALDDRIKVAVPVAGITDLQNHVVDGCVEGHCDCMYMVNTYRWDFPQLAAMMAPRPLLIANTDRDKLFPFDGVVRVYEKVRHLYDQAGKPDNIALQMAGGPHEDLQVLQLYALEWFNQHLKGENPIIESAAKDYFKPEELKVFDKLPGNQTNSHIHESFVAKSAVPTPPVSQAEWQKQRDEWMKALRQKCFAGWPGERPGQIAPLHLKRVLEAEDDNFQLVAYEFDSQENVTLPLYVLLPKNVPRSKLRIAVSPVDEAYWDDFLAAMRSKFGNQIGDESLPPPTRNNFDAMKTALEFKLATVVVAPRGIGPTRWTSDPKKRIHARRRFMLLGQTLDAMRVWDIRRAVQAVRSIDDLKELPVGFVAIDRMAALSLYAALFEPNIEQLEIGRFAKSHRDGPDFLNILRFLDVPQTVAMVAERSHVAITQDNQDGWEYPLSVAKNLGWKDRFEVVPPLTESERKNAKLKSSP